jgi:hypothetical protein
MPFTFPFPLAFSVKIIKIYSKEEAKKTIKESNWCGQTFMQIILPHKKSLGPQRSGKEEVPTAKSLFLATS